VADYPARILRAPAVHVNFRFWQRGGEFNARSELKYSCAGRRASSFWQVTPMFDRFGLVLVVNHDCNLRCSYCHTGAKFARSMSPAIGRQAIARAPVLLLAPVRSLRFPR